MTTRTFVFAIVAATFAYFGVSVASSAAAQTPGRLVARSPDLTPIPSRIEHGVVSVRNVGAAASAPSVVTVNCHQVGQRGGCVDVPDRLIAPYEDAAFPNLLVVQVPALQPGQVYNHTLTFWDDIAWPAGAYQFDFVADASAANAESNEGNNTGSHVWNAP